MSKPFFKEIDLGDGSGVQRYEGESWEEVVDKIAEAQVNATKKIAQLDGENKSLKRRVLTQPESGAPDPDGPLPEFKARTLSADEKFALGQRLANPATAADAIMEAIEAGLGANPEQVRRALHSAAVTPRQLRGRDAAESFLNNHPEFVTTKENSDAMFEYMTGKKMALTTENFEIAFGELSAAGLLQLRAPKEPANGDGGKRTNGNGAADSALEPEVQRPRFASTSVAARNSGTPRGGTGPKMPTAEEIDRMSPAEYRRRHSDPATGAAFRAHVDKIETDRAARARR